MVSQECPAVSENLPILVETVVDYSFKQFWTKFSNFLFKLADWNGDFWPNLNQKVLYSGNSTLRQKLDQTVFKPPKSLGKFLLKYIFGQILLAKT